MLLANRWRAGGRVDWLIRLGWRLGLPVVQIGIVGILYGRNRARLRLESLAGRIRHRRQKTVGRLDGRARDVARDRHPRRHAIGVERICAAIPRHVRARVPRGIGTIIPTGVGLVPRQHVRSGGQRGNAVRRSTVVGCADDDTVIRVKFLSVAGEYAPSQGEDDEDGAICFHIDFWLMGEWLVDLSRQGMVARERTQDSAVECFFLKGGVFFRGRGSQAKRAAIDAESAGVFNNGDFQPVGHPSVDDATDDLVDF